MLLNGVNYKKVFKNQIVKNALLKNPDLQTLKNDYGEGFAFDVSEASYVFTKDYKGFHVNNLRLMLDEIGFEAHPDLKKYMNLTESAKMFYDELVELYEM